MYQIAGGDNNSLFQWWTFSHWSLACWPVLHSLILDDGHCMSPRFLICLLYGLKEKWCYLEFHTSYFGTAQSWFNLSSSDHSVKILWRLWHGIGMDSRLNNDRWIFGFKKCVASVLDTIMVMEQCQFLMEVGLLWCERTWKPRLDLLLQNVMFDF